MHVRQTITTKIATALTGLTTTTTHVYLSRLTPLAASELPALTITDTDEVVDIEQSPFGQAYRQLSVEINGLAAGATGAIVSATLNTIASEVETKMASTTTLDSTAIAAYLVATDKSLNDDGDGATGSIKLTYRVEYITASGAPDTPII